MYLFYMESEMSYVSAEKFPNVRTVMEMLDVTVLDGGHGAVYLGCPPELAAGLYGYQVTPALHSLDALNDWCTRHLDAIRAAAADPDGPAPDFTELDAPPADVPYPHPISCVECRMDEVCNFCGALDTRPGTGRCVNGRCTSCCAKHCDHRSY